MRAFLDLIGYYRKFIRQYAQIAAPMTDLLKKIKFQWTREATNSFNKLKEILTSAPVLVYLNFSIPFVVEMDACDVGVGAILL